MKKVLVVMVVISFCLIMAGIAGAAEAVKKPGTTMQKVTPGVVQPPKRLCPLGFTFKSGSGTGSYICERTKPANPCPSGYVVRWGQCNKGTSMTDTGDPNCTFACIPQVPSFIYPCAPPDYEPSPGACEVGCRRKPI